jgi:hypothetical protein
MSDVCVSVRLYVYLQDKGLNRQRFRTDSVCSRRI